MSAPSTVKLCLKHGTEKLRRPNGIRSGKQTFAYVCLQCKHEISSKWGAANKDHIKEYRDNGPYRAQTRNSQLKRTFGITLDDYNKMFMDQNGCCKGCDRHQSEFKRALCVDHCHKTGKIRGLLCDDCNVGLGRLRDNPQTLINLAEYLNYNDESGT